MAISVPDLLVILRLRKTGILDERFAVADVGAQQLGNDVLRNRRILPVVARLFAVPLQGFGSTDRTDKTLPVDAPSARRFWEWLGCSYTAIDIDGSPGSLPLDLNVDEVPAEHKGRYQLVMNLGTTEHVADQNQAMKVVHDLTAVGGVMIHTVPMQGYSNHGLLNYNPKFFWMLAKSCRYHWLDMRISYDTPMPLSADIIGEVTRFSSAAAKRLEKLFVTDVGFMAVMQKREDIPFVPPIDAGDAVAEQRLRERYWADAVRQMAVKRPAKGWLRRRSNA